MVTLGTKESDRYVVDWGGGYGKTGFREKVGKVEKRKKGT